MFYKAQNDINMAFYDLSFKKMGKNGYRFSVAIPKSIVFFSFSEYTECQWLLTAYFAVDK